MSEQPAKAPKAKRVICGLCVAAVWLVAIFLLPVWALAGLVMLSACVCLYELRVMLGKVGYALPFPALAALTVVWFAVAYLGLSGVGETMGTTIALLLALPLVFVAGVIALFFTVALDARVPRPMETAALAVAAFVYIPVMLSFFLPIAMVQPPGVAETDHAAGIFAAFALVLVTKLADTGGYFVGTAIGRHKMCPRLSPGKSWEGTAGGYLFSLVGAGCVIAAAHVWPEARCLAIVRALAASVPAILWLLLTVAAVVTVGICGDLLESLFKRQCGVKDSSALFPAMGGFFDTFDSVIFAPATAIIMIALGAVLGIYG